MNNPFCLPPLLISCAGLGVTRMHASSMNPDKRQAQPGGKNGSQRNGPAAPRRPIVGEALIDTDGVVWLVESVKPLHEAPEFVTNVARVTKTGAIDTEPTSHSLTRTEFEAFCSAKGIVLRGG